MKEEENMELNFTPTSAEGGKEMSEINIDELAQEVERRRDQSGESLMPVTVSLVREIGDRHNLSDEDCIDLYQRIIKKIESRTLSELGPPPDWHSLNRRNIRDHLDGKALGGWSQKWEEEREERIKRRRLEDSDRKT